MAKPEPDLAGGYFRSDHFSFAKSGIPAFSIEGGHDYVKDAEAASAKAKAYNERYHQVSDEYDASWDLSGMVQQAQFTLNLGRMIANAPKMPAWKAGDAFGKIRAGGSNPFQHIERQRRPGLRAGRRFFRPIARAPMPRRRLAQPSFCARDDDDQHITNIVRTPLEIHLVH